MLWRTALGSRRLLASATNVSLPALNQVPTIVSSLPNGMRVASETREGEVATVGIFINSGSRYDPPGKSGVAHFLEHLTFKGTSNRSKRDLEVGVENMGAQLNAYTSREQTVYYMRVFKEDVPKAVEILGDMLQNSLISEEAIEAERSVILQEMDSVNNIPSEFLLDQLHATAYQGSPLANTILGPVESIRTIKRNDLIDYVNKHYTSDRVVLAGAGAVNHEQLKDLAAQHLSKFQPSTTRVEIQPTLYTGSDIRIENDDPLAHFVVAVEGASWTNPDSITLMVMQAIMGRWDRLESGGKNLGSKMCAQIAEKNLAHSVSSFNTLYSDTGLFGCMAVAEPGALDDLLFEIQNEWMRLVHKPTEEEVVRAKNQLKTSYLLELSGTTSVCEDIGRQLLVYGRRVSPSEIFARIDAVTPEAIRECGEKYIYDRDPVLSAMGPLKSLPDYNKVRRWTYWLRT